MCILFFSFKPKPINNGYKLILAANRDEYFNRPAAPVHYWEKDINILGGMDLTPGKEGGTWLAFSRNGRLGILLNMTQNKRELEEACNLAGRGFFISQFLQQTGVSLTENLRNIATVGNQYDPFKLVMLDLKQSLLGMVHNHGEAKFSLLEPGVYGMGNNHPHLKWRKVEAGTAMFEEIISQNSPKDTLVKDLFGMLNCNTKYHPDPVLLAQTEGRTATFQESISSIFVDIAPIAGTRTQTVVLVDANNLVTYHERTLPDPLEDRTNWKTKTFEFQLSQNTD